MSPTLRQSIVNTPYTRLPDIVGVVATMDEFFLPNDCKGKVVARRGKIKHAEGGVVDGIMVGGIFGDNFNLLFDYYDAKAGKWERSLQMLSSLDEFLEGIAASLGSKYREELKKRYKDL